MCWTWATLPFQKLRIARGNCRHLCSSTYRVLSSLALGRLFALFCFLELESRIRSPSAEGCRPMLFSAEMERRPTAPALPPESLGKAVPGHEFRNFSLPIMKTWGNKRVLRCVSVGEGAGGGDGPGGRRSSRDLEAGSGDRSAVEEVREKLMVHLREVADRINLIVHRAPLPLPSKVDDHAMEAVPAEDPETDPSSTAAAWPWKLRTRRRGARVQAAFERRPSASLPVAGEKRSNRPLTSESMERSECPNFSVILSREEIDEDIYAVTGHRARRRPRKRPRLIQKQLDMLFPGSWLSEITVDSYKLPE